MTEHQIPQDVYDAINDPYEGFDKLYFSFVPKCKTNEEAFEATVDRMQEFFPKWKRYTSYISYATARNRRYSLRRT